MIRVGDPILLDGEWSLVERKGEDWHAGLDDMVAYLQLRHRDGTQSRVMLRDLRERSYESFEESLLAQGCH